MRAPRFLSFHYLLCVDLFGIVSNTPGTQKKFLVLELRRYIRVVVLGRLKKIEAEVEVAFVSFF